ncbi:ABC transporter permease [Rubrobacter aplysinae]|uniref:ABC transporter permease n=1 Tax=Rubrobacter aplysinae TaxID=909625 RepID=UPI00064C0FAC|nr:ABC transporter permease [Rubrobacter aplysinae]
MGFLEFLADDWEDLLETTIGHAQLVLVSLIAATLTGIVLGLLTYRREFAAEVVLAVASTILTIPSFALFALALAAGFGLGFTPAFIALWLYGILAILRNTITGLRSVDPAVVESAQGMGMSGVQTLLRIELPLAWPVIVAGVRTSALILMGIAAIAAVVGGPGLGDYIFSGLSRVGGANALNQVLTGTLGIVVLAIIFDGVLGIAGRLATSRGVR